jgi:UDP-2,3-diacylglucosamine pyrophosphatase LpxH
MPSKLLDLGESENLIVVSDVHMRTPDDERSRLFCKFLDRVGSDVACDTLVLLGDIFDFFNARQVFYYRLWKDVLTRIRVLNERGVRVVFVEGNHDYGFEHSPCKDVKDCFFDCGDVILRTKHPALGEIVLLHSDDVVCPPSYRAFRSLVKSRTFQSVLSPVPGAVTSALFSRYAKISRAKDDYRPLDSTFLTVCAEQFITVLQAVHSLRPDVCVFGHIHVDLDDSLQNVHFLSGPAWFSRPSFLCMSEQGTVVREWLDSSSERADKFKFADR